MEIFLNPARDKFVDWQIVDCKRVEDVIGPQTVMISIMLLYKEALLRKKISLPEMKYLLATKALSHTNQALEVIRLLAMLRERDTTIFL